MSDIDRALFRILDTDLDLAVIPNGVDTDLYAPYPLSDRGKSLLFVGSLDYQPNADAVMYAYKNILPLLHRNKVDSEFTIIGKNPPEHILALQRNAQARLLLRGCSQQSWSKLRATMLAKLAYNQTSVYTPTLKLS